MGYVTPGVAITAINEFILSIIALYLFNSRLWKFIMNMDDHNINSNKPNDKQQNLLGVIVRTTLLNVIAIIATQIMYATLFLSIIFVGQNEQTEDIWVIFRSLQSCICLIDSLTIFLNLRFNKNIYFKVCKCCNNGCYILCLKFKSMVSKRHLIKNDLDYVQME